MAGKFEAGFEDAVVEVKLRPLNASVISLDADCDCDCESGP